MRAPYIFSSDYKHFYCQYNEPSYVKKLKLEMLTAVANESNTYEIGKKLQFAREKGLGEGAIDLRFAFDVLFPGLRLPVL